MPLESCKFGEFELDSARFELRRNGSVQKLERIPLELLILLAERDGNVVSRQEIIERLWGKDVFVDTDHGINTAIRKIRQALHDNPERPRFVQTVTGKGYRFVAETQPANGKDPAPVVNSPASSHYVAALPAPAEALPDKPVTWRLVGVAAIALCLIAGLFLIFNVRGLRNRVATNQLGPIHSLAVLPLTNLSGDPSQDYYADGMTDELITALAENHALRVVSRTSGMQYKGVNKPLREIAQALGVDGIMEGSVNRSGNNVHINLQLIYAPTDTHMWAQSYDRDPSGALLLPQEIAQIVASVAKVASAPTKVKRYVSPEAHDAYLRGRYIWFGGNMGRSREYFEKAIQLQPDYAAAWSGLSDTYGASAVMGEAPPKEAWPKEYTAAVKALELDDSLAEAHNSMAAFYFFNAWDWKRAEAEELRAIELDPNYAEGRHLHSYILGAVNRNDESLQEQKRSSELDPFARPWALGAAYIHLRQYDAAIKALQMEDEVQPQQPMIQFCLLEAYWLKGKKKEAGKYAERMFLIGGDQPSADAVQQAFKRGVDPRLGELLLRQDEELARKRYRSPIHFAFDNAMLERKEETLRALEDGFRERDPWLVFLQKEPVFDFLHAEPRYRALVAKMGMPPAY